MPWDLKVGGVSKKSSIDQLSGVEIQLNGSERSTARFTTSHGYKPDLRAEVVIYDTDGTTAIFGGIVFSRDSRGIGHLLKTDIVCSDWTWYLDNVTMPGAELTGTYTLKQVLEWIQTNILAARGFTLDPAQVTGPSWDVTGYTWERKTLSAFLRDNVGPATQGYVFYITPAKVWGMKLANLAVADAPFSITDGSGTSQELQWKETSANYANKIILPYGDGLAPAEVTAGTGLIERILPTATGITEEATAQAEADGWLAALNQSPRTFEIDTRTPGLAPGQVIAIVSTIRDTSAKALITKVEITLQTDEFWRWRAEAISGIYQGSSLDAWRGGGSGGGSMGGIVISAPPVGHALTKADDTNVTLTLGGGHAAAVLAATSITAGWTGTLAAARGGTGQGSYAVGDLLHATGASALSRLAVSGTAGTFLRSTGTAPAWSTLVLPNAATANQIVRATATNAYGGDSSLTFDGSLFTVFGDAEMRSALSDTDGRTITFLQRDTTQVGGQGYGRISFVGSDASAGASGERGYIYGTAGTLGASGEMDIVFGTARASQPVAETMRLTNDGRLGLGNGIPLSGVHLELARQGVSTIARVWTASDTAGLNARLDLERTRGTLAAPEPLQADDLIGAVNAFGWDSTRRLGAAIRFYADGDWFTADDPTDAPGRISFWTVLDGSASLFERLRITNAGQILTGAATQTSGAGVGDIVLPNNSGDLRSVTQDGTSTFALIRGDTSNRVAIASASVETIVGGALSAPSLTLTSTPLAATSGGTGTATVTTGDLLYGSAANTWSRLAGVAAGSYLRSGGVGVAPLWSTLVLPNAATVNQIVRAVATNTYGQDANLTFDGTTFQVIGDANLRTAAADTDGRTFTFTQTDTTQSNVQGYGRISFVGSDASAGADGERGYIYGVAGPTGTTGAFDLVFGTAPASSPVAEVMRLTSDGRAGLGNGAPATGIHFETARQSGNNFTRIWVASDTATEGAHLRLDRNRGTLASPSPLQADDLIGQIQASGWDSTRRVGASIRFHADAEWFTGGDTTDGPTRVSIWTVPDGSSTQFERLRIANGGQVLLGAATQVDGAGAGDLVLPNNSGEIRAVNAAGTGTFPLISSNTSDQVTIAASGTLTSVLGDVTVSGQVLSDTRGVTFGFATPDFRLYNPSANLFALRSTADILTIDHVGNTNLLAGHIGSDHYASQTTGWRTTYAGAADYRYLFVDEMHAKVFIADLEQALAGGQIITKSVAMVAQAFTVPAAGAAATLWVRDLPSAANMAAFESGDQVVVRSFSRAAGSLTIADAVGVVTSYTDGSGANEGQQSWTFTRNTAPNAGTMAGGTVIAVDSLALDYGTTGNGYYEVNAIDGAYGVNSPYAQVVTWATSPVAANRTVRARFGKLTGITSTANEFGMIAGTYAASNGQFFRASNTTFELHGIDLSMWDGVTEVIRLARGGGTAPYFAVGSPVPTTYASGTGVWMGDDSGTYKFRVGNPAGVQAAWNGTTLTLGDTANEHMALSASALQIKNGATVYTDLTDGALVLGQVAANSENVAIDATNGIRFRDNTSVLGQLSSSLWTLGSTSTEHVAISSTSVQIKDGSTVYTDLTGGALTLGETANEHALINTSGVALKDGATTYALFAATTVLGAVGAGLENVQISASGINFRENVTVRGSLSGDTWVLGTIANSNARASITPTAISLITRSGAGADTTRVNLTNAGVLTLGDTANEHLYADGLSVQIKDGAAVYTDVTAGLMKIGRSGEGFAWTEVASTGVSLKNHPIGGTVATRLQLNVNGSGYLASTSISWDEGGNLIVTGNATIAGWAIGATSIGSANVTLTSGAANTAHVLVGTGSNAGGLNSANASGDIVIWGGSTHANRATAPFRVAAAGALTATNATITGTVTATAGAIGGWTLGATSLSSTNINILANGFDGNARFQVDGSGFVSALAAPVSASTDVVLYTGATSHANRTSAVFRVTHAGAATMTNATITAAGGTTTIDTNAVSITQPRYDAGSLPDEGFTGAAGNMYRFQSGGTTLGSLFAWGRSDTNYDEIGIALDARGTGGIRNVVVDGSDTYRVLERSLASSSAAEWSVAAQEILFGVFTTKASINVSVANGVRFGGSYGYATGEGGTVTQATSKSTGVTLNKRTGEITMHNASLGSDTSVLFTLTNSTVAAGDYVQCQVVGGSSDAGKYTCIGIGGAGTAQILVRNISAGALAEAVVVKYVVFKAPTS
jgi:hypothetical protein